MSKHVIGVKEMKAKMALLGMQFRQSVTRAVTNFGIIEMNEMQERVPMDTGELSNSGFVGKPEIKGNHVTLQLGFTAPHAMVVHEDLEAKHTNGEAKYLESVLNESEPFFADRVGEDVKRDLGL